MDIMTLPHASGRVILRTRPPYTREDSPAEPAIDLVLRMRKSISGTVILSKEQLDAEGEGLLDQCLRSGGESQGMMMIAVAPVIVADGLARGMQERKMVLENKIPPELELEADRDLLRIVLDNLLANAVKYGREGGKITLDAAEQDSVVSLAVSNEGAGIPADKLPQLFKKFSRLDLPAYRGKKGTGLGLYICNEILEKHGGRIQAESKEGEWVRFSIALPKNGAASGTHHEG